MSLLLMMITSEEKAIEENVIIDITKMKDIRICFISLCYPQIFITDELVRMYKYLLLKKFYMGYTKYKTGSI